MANSNSTISNLNGLFKELYSGKMQYLVGPSEEDCWLMTIEDLERHNRSFNKPYIARVLKIRKSKLNRYLDGGE
jgi:hypothetical protein